MDALEKCPLPDFCKMPPPDNNRGFEETKSPNRAVCYSCKTKVYFLFQIVPILMVIFLFFLKINLVFFYFFFRILAPENKSVFEGKKVKSEASIIFVKNKISAV